MGLDRRGFLRAVGAAAAGVALGGCGVPGAARELGSRDDLLTFRLWASGAELAAFRAIARDFEAAEGVAVRFQPVAFDQHLASVDAGLQSGQPPDVFRVTYPELNLYAAQGALLDLAPYLPTGYADAFRPEFWAAVTDGARVSGVPHHTDTSMILVNLDAAAAAGLDRLPTTYDEAWTWEELDDVLLRLQAVSGPHQAATGVNWQQYGAYRWLNFLAQAGGRLLTHDLDASAVDSPEGLEALRFTQSFFTRGLVPPSTSTKGDYVADLFGAGALATVFAGDFVLPEYADVGFPYTATFLPVHRQAAAELGGSALVAAADGPRAGQAAAFLRFCVEEEQMTRFCERTAVLPTRSGLTGADLDYAVRPDLLELYVQQSQAIPQALVAQTTIPSFPAVNAALVEQLDRAFVGLKDPVVVLAALAADVERVLRD